MPYWELVYVAYWTADGVTAAGSVVVTVSGGFVADDGVEVLCPCTDVCAGVPGEGAVVVVHPAIKIPGTSSTTIKTLNTIFGFFISIRFL